MNMDSTSLWRSYSPIPMCSCRRDYNQFKPGGLAVANTSIRASSGLRNWHDNIRVRRSRHPRDSGKSKLIGGQADMITDVALDLQNRIREESP